MPDQNLSPRIVKSSNGWYIEYYLDKADGSQKRVRKTFGLNRINDENERNLKAHRILKEIETGQRDVRPKNTADVSIQSAFRKSLNIKEATVRKATFHSYRSKSEIFLRYLQRRNLHQLDLSKLNRKIIMQFLDYTLVKREVGPSTYNNYILKLHAVIDVMVKRDVIKVNPFSNIPKQNVAPKLRRCFNHNEKKIVFDEIRQRDPLLMVSVILLYGCAIRPAEMRRLKRRDIDLENGVIYLRATITKNKKDGYVTIANEFIPYLTDIIGQVPGNYWLFGLNWKPDPDGKCGKNQFNRRHSQILESLKRQNKLQDIEGLSFYSWKDTAATDLSTKIDLVSLMKHFRHQSLDETQKYIDRLKKVDPTIQNLDFGLMD